MNENSLRQVAPFPRLLEGFQRSLGRFQSVAYAELPPIETYIPLFETLNWSASIADWLGKDRKPDLLRAVEYARNAVHHEWIQALRLGPRGFGEGTFGEGTFGGPVWRWRASEELPVRKPDKDREPLYRSLLGGKSALDTLRELDRRLQGEAEGYVASASLEE
jgi:hypothetical protein